MSWRAHRSSRSRFVRKSELDVAFVLGTPDLPGCEVTRFWAEYIYVAIPQGHMLCNRDEVTWKSLRDEKVILCRSELGCALHDHLIERLAQFGSRPRVERLDVGREILMHLVALGLGVSLTTEATVATQFPEVVFRPVAGDAATIPFTAVSLPNNDNPACRRFMSLVRGMAKKWEPQPRNAVARPSARHEKRKPIGYSRRARPGIDTASIASALAQTLPLAGRRTSAVLQIDVSLTGIATRQTAF